MHYNIQGTGHNPQVHRTMVAEEEYKLLKMARINRKLDAQKGVDSHERSACLVALYPADELAGGSGNGGEPVDSRLLVDSTLGGPSSSSSSNGSGSGSGLGSHSSPVRGGGATSEVGPAPGQLAVVGTLDLHAVRALPGELLIGSSQNAAYLANVCTAKAAQRRGVGAALLQAARRLAVRWGEAGQRVGGRLPDSLWVKPQQQLRLPGLTCHCLKRIALNALPTGVEDLYVHTMAVNEIACSFYERQGFVVEKVRTVVHPVVCV